MLPYSAANIQQPAALPTELKGNIKMDIVVSAYHHIRVDASNHYAPEPSVVYPTVSGDSSGSRTRTNVSGVTGRRFNQLNYGAI